MGHFLAAKLNKIDVLEFGMGIPPRLWGKKIGDTIYSINWLPFGGFVRMLGQNDFSVDGDSEARANPGHFENKSPLARAVVILAGVFMNFVSAILFLWLVYSIGTQAILPGTNAYEHGVTEKGVAINEIIANSPASQSMLLEDDVITQINGTDILGIEEFITFISEHPNEPLTLTVERNENSIEEFTELEIPVTVSSEGKIGIALSPNILIEEVKYPFYKAIVPAMEDFGAVVKMSFDGLGMLVTSLAVKQEMPEEIAGPVGIVRITGVMAHQGFSTLLYFMAVISISIGILNILPIPALDGGRFLFILYEMIFRKKPNKDIEGRIHLAGFALLLLLILLITFQDIANIPAVQDVAYKVGSMFQ
jgi:regulator of sigma E protease